MNLPIEPPFAPMEAEQVETIPEGAEWGYEPKWDGFRCVAFRDGDDIYLQSKSCKPLARYFPEVVSSLRALGARRFVLDGELVVPVRDALSFDQLLQRIHPAESRVRRLAEETPALFVVFDLLLGERGGSLVDTALETRRARLEAFAGRYLGEHPAIRLSPHTRDPAQAQVWLAGGGDGLDGTVAKRLDLPYLSGERSAMRKVKRYRSADCVVGGIRWSTAGDQVGSLLLGLYDGPTLHHVGFCSGFNRAARAAATERIRPFIGGSGFSGRAPGGPSRWATERSAAWVALRPELVVEVGYDHFSEGRFRHGTRFLRWRPDKSPRHCTFAQIATGGRSSLALLRG
jgi:ATP-dependent DNA ligase